MPQGEWGQAPSHSSHLDRCKCPQPHGQTLGAGRARGTRIPDAAEPGVRTHTSEGDRHVGQARVEETLGRQWGSRRVHTGARWQARREAEGNQLFLRDPGGTLRGFLSWGGLWVWALLSSPASDGETEGYSKTPPPSDPGSSSRKRGFQLPPPLGCHRGPDVEQLPLRWQLMPRPPGTLSP